MFDLIKNNFDKLLIMWLLHVAVATMFLLMWMKADEQFITWATGLTGTIVGSLLTLINARLFGRKTDTNGAEPPPKQ